MRPASVVAVLHAACGRGYARLLAAAPEHRAVLLEALGPALERSGLAPERQIEILCAALRDAWQVPAPDAAPEAKAEALADLVGRLCGTSWIARAPRGSSSWRWSTRDGALTRAVAWS